MMMVLTSTLRRWQRLLRKMILKRELRSPALLIGGFLAGLALSAASLANTAQPFAAAVLCAGLPGWLPLPYALGAGLGYWLFWGEAGVQGIAWVAAGLPVCVLLSNRRQQTALLMSSIAALILSASGVAFQVWMQENTPIALYLLRIGLAFGATWLFAQVRQRRDGAADWVALSIFVLGLSQIAPVSWLNLGILTAAMLVSVSAFPAVALAGLAVDLAQVTPVPMTAVLVMSYLLRLLPVKRQLLGLSVPMVYVGMMLLCGKWDLLPVPALAVGALLSLAMPRQIPIVHRRGETGFAQVRLEMASNVLMQAQHQLLELPERPVDEAALLEKAAQRACGSCPCRKNCKYIEQTGDLSPILLHKPLAGPDDVPVDCKKRGRLLLELRRAQDQLRLLLADRQRQAEYRGAVTQQYQFLAEFLQDLADRLPQRGKVELPRFQPEVAVCSQGKELANGDRCLWFAGTECRYYLLLCDGMGTGLGAAEEAKAACNMLRKLLMAGFPAPYALRSLNSLCTLRDRAGAVTIDLAEIQLQNGRATLYKWGAAPSYLLTPTGAERLGAVGTPPGFSVQDCRESVDRLSLRRGEALVLLSDGIQPEAAIENATALASEPPGALAARLLEQGREDASDDATAAVVRLLPVS